MSPQIEHLFKYLFCPVKTIVHSILVKLRQQGAILMKMFVRDVSIYIRASMCIFDECLPNTLCRVSPSGKSFVFFGGSFDVG